MDETVPADPLSDDHRDVSSQDNRPTTPINRFTADVAQMSLNLASPKSDGSGSFTTGGGFTDSRAIYPWIARDIEPHQHCDFDAFLKCVLEKVDKNIKLDPDERLQNTLRAILNICHDKEIRGRLGQYCQTARVEDRYGPFVKCSNDALALLVKIKVPGSDYRPADKMDILFCRNANKDMIGHHTGTAGELKTQRKPDIILTSGAAAARVLRQPHSKSCLLAKAAKQPLGNFEWHDVLAFWEFKLNEKTLSSCKSQYDTTPSILRYRPMDATSQTSRLDVETATDPVQRALTQKNWNPGVSSQQRARLPRSCQTERRFASNPETRLSKQPAQSTEVNSERPCPAVHAALYGSEMLCRGPGIAHAIGAVIIESVLHVWWYDREGAIQTYGLDFLEDLPRFITLLFAFQRFSFEDWGFIPDLGRTDSLIDDPPMYPAPIYLTGGPHGQTIFVNTADIVYKPLVLKGRGTSIFASTCTAPGDTQQLVTKFLWADNTHLSEGTIIARVFDRGRGDERITNHMPIVVDVREYHPEYNTGTVRHLCKRRLQENGAEVDVYRDLRVLTMVRLKPIQTLEGEAFVGAWWQCVQAHYLIWFKHKIHHKDPSLNNVRYRCDRNGTIHGVLNDWDLAVDASEPHAHDGFEATGTIPFMAVNLLCEEAWCGQVRHLYRHDLEAFLWIFVWVLCCYKYAKEVSPLPDTYRRWNSGDTVVCRSSKRDLLQRGFKPADGPTTSWTAESPLARYILTYLCITQQARDNIWMVQQHIQTQGSGLEEADEPEKVCAEFCATVITRHPAISYIPEIPSSDN